MGGDVHIERPRCEEEGVSVRFGASLRQLFEFEELACEIYVSLYNEGIGRADLPIGIPQSLRRSVNSQSRPQ